MVRRTAPKSPVRVEVSVEAATRADLGKLAPVVQRSALASLALRLAVVLDGEPSSSTPAVARELRLTLERLLLDVPAEGDGVDDLIARREARRGA